MKLSLICLFSLFLLLGSIVSAQETDSTRKYSELIDQVSQFFEKKEYRKAIETSLEAVKYPEADQWKYRIYYNVSCSYSLLNDAENAFKYLDSTVTYGYSNYGWISQDSDFDFLRENYKEKFDAILKRVKTEKTKEILRKSPLAVVEYENYNGPLDISDYPWEDINRPEMDSLRVKYRLHEVVGSDGTEFEKMKRLLNWVATRWKHDGSKMAPKRTALAILSEVDKGKRFCCANYADVLIDCMKSLGYPIRFTGLRTEDAAYYMGGGHGCVEVWSNQYQKWIFLDVQNNAWWEHDNIPLSAYECHKLFVNGKEDELRFMGQHEQVDYDQIKKIWSVYFYRVVNYWMGLSLYLISDSEAPPMVYQEIFYNLDITDQYDKVYPKLNQTEIIIQDDKAHPMDSLTVILANTMPYFDKYMVRIDGEKWKQSSDKFLWALKNGTNTIEAKAINMAGIEGRTSRIVLQNNLQLSEQAAKLE